MSDDYSLVTQWMAGSRSERENGLKAIIGSPVVDPRLITTLENMLHDTTPCVIAIPYLYGEIRWLAGRALCELLAALSMPHLVVLDAVEPLYGNELYAVAAKSNVKAASGVEGALETFQRLRDANYLRVTRCTFGA